MEILRKNHFDLIFVMSLFVGNVSRNVSEKELETEFIEFGSCKVEKKVVLD